MKLPFIEIVESVDGRDRWVAGTGNSIRWAWSAPRWLSWRSVAAAPLVLALVLLAIVALLLYPLARYVAGRGP